MAPPAQGLQVLPPELNFSCNHPVIGYWIIGGEPADIGLREDTSLIPSNTSLFSPHWF
ncbi:MAG: hypothetical protein B7Z37_20785 [Verrucomicrobia bacterium 12-59-8]|nr:MAG: hypothetical protein B7Z37_20785 [Verrucomicrobia bacterium 12-59-8]